MLIPLWIAVMGAAGMCLLGFAAGVWLARNDDDRGGGSAPAGAPPPAPPRPCRIDLMDLAVSVRRRVNHRRHQADAALVVEAVVYACAPERALSPRERERWRVSG